MSDNLVKKVDDLADVMGDDQQRQDKFMKKIAPEDAGTLHNQALDIHAASTTKFTGFLSSDALAAYKTGHGAGTQVPYIIKDATFTLATPNVSDSVNAGDMGLLELYINNVLVDQFDLAAAFDSTKEDSNQSYPPANSANGKLTIVSVSVFNKIWQKLNARINVVESDLLKGYNAIVLVHKDTLEGDQTSQTFDVFYDDAPTTPSLNAITLAIHENTNPKYLSGVKYLGTGDKVKAGVIGEKLFDNSYVINPIRFSGNGLPTVDVAPTDTSVSGLSTPPVVGEMMTVTDKILTVANGKCDADTRVAGLPRDPFGSYSTITSASQKILLSSLNSASSKTMEHFNNEEYRLPLNWNSNDKTSAITGNWDSQAALNPGDAQQFISADNEHSLMYPALDFSNGYQPPNTVNYAGRSGNQQYLRAIEGSSAKSSVDIVLNGTTGGIAPVGSGDVNVEIKLPGVGGWWDCAKPFGGSLGANDGEGCMVGAISYAGGKATINATFGTNSSFNSNNRFYLRITLRNGNRIVKSITTNW